MILVLSNVANESAIRLVEAFPPGAASLVTASNLHASFKVAVDAANFSSSRLTFGDIRISAAEISGVVTTIAYFLPQEFLCIEPADRDYVCAEVGAFFIYFLSELQCVKLNPPSPKALSGLGMHRLEWMKAAHHWGIPVWPARLRNGLLETSEAPQDWRAFRATVIGNSIVEKETPDSVGAYTRALSQAFSMPYLCADFVSRNGSDYFLADLWSVPDVTVPANREAIARLFGAPVA